jgi:polysaccharide deacetylase family protein (PEP-CTERM system associated)
MKHILTIDVEEWYHGNYNSLDPDSVSRESRVESNTEEILEILENIGARGTFFILGEVAEKKPSLVKKIFQHGHEIASHGYNHNLVYNYTQNEFKEDVKKSKSILEDCIGSQILGYRSPSWSVKKDTLWFYETLESLGIRYSSSVFPIANYLYGIKDAPRFYYKPNEELSIYEIPCSTSLFLNKRIPFSGGFYFRLLPFFLINYFSNQVSLENNPVLFYLHPREIDPFQPRLSLTSTFESFVHHYGIKSCKYKLLKLLNQFKLTSIQEFYSLE